ncbi:putative meiotic regulator-interacting protein [Trichodelitschia bisporula]|uniref:Putative meiotic regulator-interacting protein n=1 Tax=Trichodelitschia bisporula TaxID=703511 RepID=A0A6G1HNI3_9PEZI|nr:putative meiotic regulator-interacting protein [Trichodelitschia bisporula]
MTMLAPRPKGPQPVLELADDSDSHSDKRPSSAPRPDAPPPLNRSSTHHDDPRRARAAVSRPGLQRARSDFSPLNASRDDTDSKASEGEWGIRHGFETQLVSEEYNRLLNSNFFLYFTDKKHDTSGNPKGDAYPLQEWRMRDRLKTVSAVLALCLNIGVDPPDVIKTNPSSKLECWVDPTSASGAGGNLPLNSIGKALQSQYEQLSMRTRYKLCLDPTVDETRRYTSTLRRNARNERVLFHYNGHGVPKPTPSGEIWVFNRNYTQYIPISLYDLQTWIGAPSLFVYDCSEAGLIIQNFLKFAEKHETENLEIRRRDPTAEIMDFADCIHLAACREKETLPTNPDLPADVFTSCLTTPIDMAVRFFILQNPLQSSITLQDASSIPGRVSERRTPIGELNWIFTAITDTIAWNSLPKHLFKKLFRQDLMVAALFRNYLLAQRIMRVYHCHPQCHPEIPQTHDHPLWRSWDLAVEMILSQLPDLLAHERGEKHYEYQHSNFFAEQLTAFEVYLSQGAAEKKNPEQLPVVLQVLLSQVHRLRALILLSKFLDLGPWAVNLALSIGIFPYVLKLLQSQAIELKPVMVFIWARILAVDQSCQTDLLKDNGYQYFVHILNPTSGMPVGNASEHRAMCAFIIAMFCKDYPQGQNVLQNSDLIESCLAHLGDLQNPLLRQWCCLCISMLWVDCPPNKWTGVKCLAHQRLCDLVFDPVPEVRAAMLVALTTFLGIPDLTPQVAQIEESIAAMVLILATDGNAIVRKELLVFFSTFIVRYENRFLVAAYEHIQEEKGNYNRPPEEGDPLSKRPQSSAGSEDRPEGIASHTVFAAIWKQVLVMSVDPHPEIAQNGAVVVDCVMGRLIASELGPLVNPFINTIRRTPTPSSSRSSYVEVHQPERSQPPTPPTPSRPEGYLTASLKRTASVAASIKNLAFGSSPEPPRSLSALRMDRGPRKSGDWNRPPDEKDPHHSVSTYPPLKTPTTKFFHPRDPKEAQIPLPSQFYDWSVEYFREPQMKPNEADEPGSTDYNERLWRRNRNDRIIAKTQPQKEMAGSNPWDKSKAFLNNGTQPMKMCFHQFEEHLIITDDRDGVNVWDWKKQARLNRFSNGNPARSRITEVRLINEDDQAMLMTGSSDGVIKVFRNYESQQDVELVTSFRALTDLEPSNKSAGLVFDWQQSRGMILVAGDVRSIRVWNAGTEVCTADINARSGSPITSLTSDQVEGHLFAAGFGDGALRLYDQREKPQTAMIQVWKEHKSWITNVHLQRGGQRELVSACRNGEVKLWDMRMEKSLRTIRATGDTLRSLSVHEHAPVFAVGTDRHVVKVFSMMSSAAASGVVGTDGGMLSVPHEQKPGKIRGLLSQFEPYSGFLNPGRGSPIATTAFHPHRMMVAGSAWGDTHVNIYSCRGRKEKAWEG